MKMVIIGTDPGMIYKFHSSLIRFLVSNGVIVHLIGSDFELSSSYHSKLQEIGAVCHSVQMDRTSINPINDFRLLAKYYKIVKSIAPDVVMAYTAKPAIYGIIASWMNGIPKRISLITGLGFVFTGAAQGRKAIVRRIMESLYRFSLSRSQHVIFQNPDDQKYFLDRNIVRSGQYSQVILGCGIDTADFRHVTPPAVSPVRFVMVARLLRDKGVAEYLAAASIIKTLGFKADFVLIGSEDINPSSISRETLVELEHGYPVNWIGPVSDVRNYLIDSDVFVLPSYREGLPQSTLEALAVGRAVITTDVPGCRETVLNGVNGLMVPSQDARSLADAMIVILEKPELIKEFGAHSRKLAEELFSSIRINDEYRKILNI